MPDCPETQRLKESDARTKNWKRWGTYLAERQWGTVREDYSDSGDCWNYFSHDAARSRAYRWGEDGILGFTDRECRLCFATAFWNGVDPILKERIFGLTNNEGNHGEDVKEPYFFLDCMPTHSYQLGLYKYPQRAYPYAELIGENARRSKEVVEYEITDTNVFDENRYFDIEVVYAKAGPEDILIQITAHNRGPDPATLHMLPTFWFRNTWNWGRMPEETPIRPSLAYKADDCIAASHATLGEFLCLFDPAASGEFRGHLFTENDTNTQKVFNYPNVQPYVKDAFHEAVVHHNKQAVNPAQVGTKAAAHYVAEIPACGSWTVRVRLVAKDEVPDPAHRFGPSFDAVVRQRKTEADVFYGHRLPFKQGTEEHRVMRQAYAGLLWSKQFYNYEVARWLKGDPGQPPPSLQRQLTGRNWEWPHCFHRDVLSMPDTWEYPWFAAWDLAFHTVEIARVDPTFAKDQLQLLLREWYMHPNGQIPAYEFAFSDVNPPVHAWAAWRVYKISNPAGKRDTKFLESTFQKLLMNFTWWVNRKDSSGRNLFSGGFLGLDNIGVFDRSKPLGEGNSLEQADGTAWMASYCLTMLGMAVECALVNPVYEDIASKFFEHFVSIVNAINKFAGSGLWDPKDGFYYDRVTHEGGQPIPLKIRSIVGLLPMIAVAILPGATVNKLPNFRKRMNWFITNHPELAVHMPEVNELDSNSAPTRVLAIPSREQLERMLYYMLDEDEFLSPYGIRSVSRYHKDHPYILNWMSEEMRVDYTPGDSTTGLFGGNSNWRGPIWMPINYLLVESLERYHHFYGNSLMVQFPSRTGPKMNLKQVSDEIKKRLSSIFMPGKDGVRPFAVSLGKYGGDPLWKDHILFNEYFHGDSGRGLGANHQTGWTALIADCLRACVDKNRED
jgi:hypothetical protein